MWGGNRRSLPWDLSVKGPPNRAEPFPVHRAHHSLPALRGSFRGVVVSKSACFFCFTLTLLTQTSNSSSYMTSVQPLARDPYVVLFDLKPLNKDSNRQVFMYCMREKEPQKPLGHTSEHVQTQNFLGACPQTLSRNL